MLDRRHIRIFLLLLSITMFGYCQPTLSPSDPDPPYQNWGEEVKYVGMQSCRGCHTEIYDTYIRTGMGQSWGHATPMRSKAHFDEHTLVYDSLNNFYYQPYWQSDSLYIKEFRLEGTDTTHQHIQHVKYIVGSGQHTNSHLYDENGHLHQAPITFYTQKGIWSLAPGFEGGHNARFNRIIGRECITCHNAYPIAIDGSENKYLKVPLGIDCERCHGPGGLHVKNKMAGDIIDTSKYIDYSIVNPAKLSRERQLSLCQRCHLQGVAILKEGKDFDDFMPGQHLWETMDVYLPEFDGPQTQFIMASQAQRMEKSECFKKSDMTCLTCHNPHLSVKETTLSTFNLACQKCHSSNEQILCSLPISEQQVSGNDCSGCHMPHSGSIDIPHVEITDHYIRKPLTEAQRRESENFVGLRPATHGAVSAHSQAQAYLNYYERFTSQPAYLDSAAHYLHEAGGQPSLVITQIHLHYLQNDYEAIRQLSAAADGLKKLDGWTAYRLGEAFYAVQNFTQAEQYFKTALEDLPLQPDFRNKLGSTYMQQNRIADAQRAFEQILEQSPSHLAALSNLGFVLVNQGEIPAGDALYDKAIALSPDYIPALLNKAGLLLYQNRPTDAKPLLKHILTLQPDHPSAKATLERLE